MSTKPTTTAGRKLRQKAIRRTLSELPDPKTAVSRILEQYAKSTGDERLEGIEWYSRARVHADNATGLGDDKAHASCAIVAALSPQCSWDQNLTNAELVVSGDADQCTQSHNAIGKATAVLAGADPLRTLGGRKVRSFYRNLLDPDRIGPVTVDRHALAVILDRSSRKDPKAAKMLERIGAYQYVAACYRTASRRLGLKPQALQAIVWLSWRNEHAPGWSGRDPQYNNF